MGQSLAIPRVIPNDWKRLDLIVNKIKFNLGRDSSPTFKNITVTGLAASRLTQTDSSKVLTSVSDLTSWIAGTSNQIVVTDPDTDGTVTLGTPQDIHTGANVLFNSLVTTTDVNIGNVLRVGIDPVGVGSSIIMGDYGGTARNIFNYGKNASNELVIQTGTSSGSRPIRFMTEGLQRLRIHYNGKVNIGPGTTPATLLTVEGALTLKEQATADADTAAYGQIYCKTAAPNQLWFVNDVGTEVRIAPQDLQTTATPTFAGLISTGIVQASDFAKTGWPITQGVTLSFVGGTTRTLTVTDDDSAYYYIDGVKYTLGGNKSVVIDDIEGLWYIYFAGDTLTASQTIWSFRAEDKATVAYLYWARDEGTPANGKAIFLGWEPHTFHMDGATHARLHYAGGARWEIGLLVSDNEDDTVDVSAGDIWDEDLNIPITDDDTPTALFEQILSPARLPIYYREGASAWRIYEIGDKDTVTDVGFIDAGDSDNLKWNDATTTWSNETVGLNNYVAYYVVATNEQSEPIALIMGQRTDNKLSDAKVNNVFSGLSLAGLPFQEMVVLARLILKDTATYTLEQVLDLRAYNIKGNITSPLITQHAGLGGLSFANAGHSGFQAQGDALDSIVALGAIADNEFIVGTGTGTYAHESGATVRTSIGVGTGDSPQLTGIELGHATDTTITRASAGNLNIEGNLIYRAGGTDVPIGDGGTGQSTAQLAINALSAVSGATNEHVLTKDTSTGNAVWKAGSHQYIDRGDPSAYDYLLATFSVEGTWTDLDLSAIVPAGAVAVHLHGIFINTGTNVLFRFRENGNSNGYSVTMARSQVANIGVVVDTIQTCDSDRKIEYLRTGNNWTYAALVIRGWWI